MHYLLTTVYPSFLFYLSSVKRFISTFLYLSIVGAEEEQGENMFSTRGKTVLAVMTALSSIFYTKRVHRKRI